VVEWWSGGAVEWWSGGSPARLPAAQHEDEVGVFVVEAARLLRIVAEVVAGERGEGLGFPQQPAQLRGSVGSDLPAGLLSTGEASECQG